jgi:hypothetical protein
MHIVSVRWSWERHCLPQHLRYSALCCVPRLKAKPTILPAVRPQAHTPHMLRHNDVPCCAAAGLPPLCTPPTANPPCFPTAPRAQQGFSTTTGSRLLEGQAQCSAPPAIPRHIQPPANTQPARACMHACITCLFISTSTKQSTEQGALGFGSLLESCHGFGSLLGYLASMNTVNEGKRASPPSSAAHIHSSHFPGRRTRYSTAVPFPHCVSRRNAGHAFAGAQSAVRPPASGACSCSQPAVPGCRAAALAAAAAGGVPRPHRATSSCPAAGHAAAGGQHHLPHLAMRPAAAATARCSMTPSRGCREPLRHRPAAGPRLLWGQPPLLPGARDYRPASPVLAPPAC